MQAVKYISFCSLLIISLMGCEAHSVREVPTNVSLNKISNLLAHAVPVQEKEDSVVIHIGTFLGNDKRNYSGNFQSDSLHEIWKTPLGAGVTIVSSKTGREVWRGAGWTGQPLIVEEKKEIYLIQGAFDHGLKKIRARDGKVIWNYAYDDILKGTGTIYRNDTAKDPDHRILILQGSRLGNDKRLSSKQVWSYRAISFYSGKEVWRMNVERGKSYSRDVDASALLVNDTAYLGLENGSLVVFNPAERQDSAIDQSTYYLPKIYSKHKLYDDIDVKKHRANIVTEASPCRIGNHVYVASGAGHVFGYNMITQQLDWDFYIGSDLDGTTIVTADSCLLVSVEKQYIKGHGGVFKLNPRKADTACVEWFFPTKDKAYATWKGGVIGSPAINDIHKASFNNRSFAAFTGIDGFLYIVDPNSTDSSWVDGPNKQKRYPTPKLIQKENIGPSISTPVFSKGRLMAAGYKGVYIFKFNVSEFVRSGFKKGNFESTPSVHNGKAYVASRNGYLYCFGNNDSLVRKSQQPDLLAMNTQEIEKEKMPTKEEKELLKDEIAKEQHIKTPHSVSKKKRDEPTKMISADTKKNSQPSLAESELFIVVGSFRSKRNAQNQLAALREQGYDKSEIIQESTGSYFRVSIQRVQHENQAKAALIVIQGTYSSAWLMHK